MEYPLRKGVGAVLILALAFALSGCGNSETTADKTFGETSEGDEQLTADVAAEMKKFTASNADLVIAMNAGEVEDARTAVDAMAEHVDKAFDIVADAENADLRTTYQNYLTKMDGVTLAAERLIAYAEAPGPARPKLEKRLMARLDTAFREAQAADKELLARLSENASPEEREQLQKRYRDAQRDFEEQTGGG